MKIVSKFKDYYDSANTWYSDRPLYIRKTEEFEFSELNRETKQILEPVKKIYDTMPSNSDVESIVIAFCGKVYICNEFDNNIFHTTKKLEAYCKKIIKDNYQFYCGSASSVIKELGDKKQKPSWWGRESLSHDSWKRFLSDTNFDIPSDSFIAMKSPVFVLTKIATTLHLITNPLLKDYNFASQVDPYTAFQEIEMYVGNEMVDQMDPNITRTDNDIRDSKGFNNWSFRKHKDENKKRRKKK
jgi:hypothetical protein